MSEWIGVKVTYLGNSLLHKDVIRGKLTAWFGRHFETTKL